jgi:hypothetical protein
MRGYRKLDKGFSTSGEPKRWFKGGLYFAAGGFRVTVKSG